MQKFYRQRQARLKKKLRDSGLDAFLITNIKNVSYLTGFSGSSGYLFVTGSKTILLSDFRYASQIEEECPGLEVEIRTAKTDMTESVKSVAKGLKCGSLGFEAESVAKSLYNQFRDTLSAELVDTVGWIEQLRAVKDKFEIAAIRKSIFVNQRAFEVVRAQLSGDQTEKQIARNLEYQMRVFGAVGCAFDPIVSVGARAALPHGHPTDTKIGESSFLLIDWGAQVDNYASDLTRILVTGKISAKLQKIYDIVLKSQLAAIRKIHPGVPVKEVDAAARSVIDKAGFGKYFGHGTGHGFGLEIHEIPFLSPIKNEKLEQNMVITVEPGIYLPGWGGVRIEDDILVTADGCEILSNLPKQLDECVVPLG